MTTAVVTKRDVMEKIEHAAVDDVRKSATRFLPTAQADIAKARAVDAFLRTERGPQLYDEYLAAPDSSLEPVTKSCNESPRDKVWQQQIADEGAKIMASSRRAA